jgi:hypothetical protein
MNNHYKKYLKYKLKYLELKNDKMNQKGGRSIRNYNNINRFSTIEYPEMEEFLNPIYGCFLAESTFVRNNYFINDADIKLDELILTNNLELSQDPNSLAIIINDNLRKKIGKLTHNIPGTPIVEPTNEIKQLTPLDFGRFIAILYFAKMNPELVSYEKGIFNCWFGNRQEPEKTDMVKLKSYIDNIGIIKDYIKLGTTNKMDFYLILYCLWYNINDDTAIDEYYDGIQEVFNITNKYSPNIYNICPSTTRQTNKISFEEAVIKTVTTDFIVFVQKSARPFCFINNENEDTYPDCGETTMRNLINLLCFRDGIFDVDILDHYGAIEELKEYYKTFNNFTKQSSNNKKEIYGLQLNARDTWSYLIIHNANNNLTFNQNCLQDGHGYNLKASSKTPDGKSINSFQLLKNLLPNVEDWGYLKNHNDDIESIEENLDQDGIGTIEIIHTIFGHIKIEYIDRHAFWHDIQKQNKFRIRHLSPDKQMIINILNKNQEITEANYLFFKYNENIIKLLKRLVNSKLYEKLLTISLTDIIDNEIRKQILINTDDKNIMKIFKCYRKNKRINSYRYDCKDFAFITEYIPQLKFLDCQIDNRVDHINLLPLHNIISIGHTFLFSCNFIQTLDLAPLSNVISIGDFFLSGCTSLEEINLLPLVNIKTIGNSFLSSCNNLLEIDLIPLANIISIGNSFLSGCRNLNEIKLSPLAKVTSIGTNFLSKCHELRKIDLSPLVNLHSVGNHFLSDCFNLTEINLAPLCNLTSIKAFFLSRCENIHTIDLSPLLNVTSIGDNFLTGCTNLTIVDLRPLINLDSLGEFFLFDCKKIEKILITPTQAKKLFFPIRLKTLIDNSNLF